MDLLLVNGRWDVWRAGNSQATADCSGADLDNLCGIRRGVEGMLFDVHVAVAGGLCIDKPSHLQPQAQAQAHRDTG